MKLLIKLIIIIIILYRFLQAIDKLSKIKENVFQIITAHKKCDDFC